MIGARIAAAVWFAITILFYILEDSLFALILLICTLGVFVCSFILTLFSGKTCKLTLDVPSEVSKGESLSVEIMLENQSLLPVFKYSFELVSENVITGEKNNLTVSLNAAPKRASYLSLILEEAFCGYVKYQVRAAKVTDPFHLFTVKRAGTATEGTFIMPRVQDMYIEPDDLNVYDMESYVYSSTQRGNDPSETFGIRAYADGDSPKTIHWKLTGKMNEVMVRELGLPVENSIMLLLDKRILNGEKLEAEIRDHATELFVSLSHALIRKDMSHSVAWQDYRNDQLITRRITCQQDLWGILSVLLMSPYREDPLSSTIHYLENFGGQKFANFLYVTAGSGSDEARLEGHGAITVYRAEEWK